MLLKPGDWFVFEELLDTYSYIKGENIVNELCQYCDNNDSVKLIPSSPK